MALVSIQNCENHSDVIQDSIQSSGLFFTLHPETLAIEQVSANTQKFLGFSAPTLLGTNILNLVVAEQKDPLQQLIQECSDSRCHPLSIDLLKDDGTVLHCKGIAQFVTEGIILLELEPLHPGAQEFSKLLSRLDSNENLETSFSKCLPILCKIFEADGAAVISHENALTHGSCPAFPDFRTLKQTLAATCADHKFDAESLLQVHPGLAGLIVIPLGHEAWLLLHRDHPFSHRDSPGRINKTKDQSSAWPEHTSLLVHQLRAVIFNAVIARNRNLEAENEELRHFASVIAHEVKSQIQTPLMALSLARELIPDPGKLEAIIELGTHALATLSDFTTEMLDYAYSNEGSKDDNEVNLTEVARFALTQAVKALSAENIGTRIHQLPIRNATRSQCHHIFLNLIRNAIIHGPANAQTDFFIEIGTLDGDSNPVFYVKDNGQGISEREQDRIFDYLYRGENSAGRKGSGIGLAFIRRLLERTGDRIWVESKPGNGATFYFTLGT